MISPTTAPLTSASLSPPLSLPLLLSRDLRHHAVTLVIVQYTPHAPAPPPSTVAILGGRKIDNRALVILLSQLVGDTLGFHPPTAPTAVALLAPLV